MRSRVVFLALGAVLGCDGTDRTTGAREPGARADRGAARGGSAAAGQRVAASSAPTGFARAFQLRFDPLGLASDGRELVATNRVTPWGLVRITREGDDAIRTTTTGLWPGSYSVSLFLHVQYVKPDGGGQILNESAMSLDLGF